MKLIEGKVEIEIEKIYTYKGPGSSGIGYYSIPMSLTRDFTILILKSYFKENFKALDMLAGTGIRGFRIEKEVGGEVYINDINKKNIEIIEKNKKMLNSNANILNYDASKCIPGYYDYIDIDPFGSPIPFIEISIKSIKNNGIIGVTSTDTANLSGTNVETCYRKYHSIPMRNKYKHELGIRILIKYFVEKAAEYDFYAYPILSIFGGYYYRVFFKMKKSRKLALKNLDYVMHLNTLTYSKNYGPFWYGNLHDISLIKSIDIPDYIQNKKKIEKLLKIMENENIFLFYDLEEISRNLKINTPKIDHFIKILNNNNINASRTQFSTTGVKTKLPYNKFKEFLMKNL
mgnify:FL=1